jgi:2-polyprenyl-6-methoxyphenol hydroxylase-like FAD-dependent oxidoreductase
MPIGPLRVGIVGCGSAGPAAALFLARAGHVVEIFERAPVLGPAGTGFILQPTGQWVLRELGLGEAAESFGAQLGGLRTRTHHGRTILDLAYGALAQGAHGLGMHRATLLELFVGAFAGSGVELHLGAEIIDSRVRGNLRLLRTQQGEHGPYDLVIIANGARSQQRDWLGSRTRVGEYTWGALWTIVRDPERRFPHHLHQVVDGTHTMLGLLPSGSRYDDPSANPLVSVFWSVRRTQLEALRAEGPAQLAARIAELEPLAEALVAGVDSMDAWSFADYVDVVMKRWHAPGLVVLGDAAHAMSPQLGQGVNLALWDAWVLAQSIADAAELDAALAAYTRSRRPHLAFYQRATRWLTPFFQSDLPVAAAARDWGLPLLGHSRFFDRQMLATMAGMKTGLFTSLPWPE